jgi:hypothetical protein
MSIAGVENIRALARDLGWRIDRLRHLLVVWMAAGPMRRRPALGPLPALSD